MGLSRIVNRILGRLDARLVRASTHRPDGAVAREESRFIHGRPAGPPALAFHLPTFEVTSEDEALTARVIAAYKTARAHERAMSPDEKPAGDLWAEIAQGSHAEFEMLLDNEDVRAAAGVLVNVMHHRVSNGLNADAGRLTYEVAASPADATGLATTIADRFVALAEALGVLCVEFPEWGRWGENIYLDLGEVYANVERAIGFSLAIPECCGMYGVRAGRHVVHPMMPYHAYACWRMFDVLDGAASPSICEIGGGYGGCAYYADQHAIDRYVIIDLPLINAIQGFFLLKTCGAQRVRLYGESDGGAPLQVLPYWMMANMPAKCFDLVFNQESLPEIDPPCAQGYVTDIARTSRRWFLSINQESQGGAGAEGFQHGVVFKMVEAHGGFRRRRRYPLWVRRGEVEELYEVMS